MTGFPLGVLPWGMADSRAMPDRADMDAEIVDEDWDGRDLKGLEHARTALIDVDMTESRLTSSTFLDCVFERVRLNAASLSGCAFLNCTFERCTFFDSTFDGCKLVGSTFERCTFTNVVVTGGDWSFVGLSGADLRSASFTDVRLRGADLTDARCEGAALRQVDLAGASMMGANLSGCDLRGSDLSSLDPTAVRLRNAIIDWQQALQVVAALGLEVRPD